MSRSFSCTNVVCGNELIQTTIDGLRRVSVLASHDNTTDRIPTHARCTKCRSPLNEVLEERKLTSK